MQTMKDLLPFMKRKIWGIRLSVLYFWDHTVQGSVHNPNVQDHFFNITPEQSALLVHYSDSSESESSPGAALPNPQSTTDLHQLQPGTFQYLTLNIFTQD